MQVSSVSAVPMSEIWSAGSAPVLGIIPEADPFNHSIQFIVKDSRGIPSSPAIVNVTSGKFPLSPMRG
jgi:hypothetical protein